MNKINPEQMTRDELLKFLKNAKAGKIETGISKVFYFINDKILLNDLKGYNGEISEDQFIERYKETDCIITFTEPDYDKYSSLKSKPFIQANNLLTAKQIQKLIKD